MFKEVAINEANHRSVTEKDKFCVIYEPDTYNDIFNGSCYKVVKKEEQNSHEIVYETL